MTAKKLTKLDKGAIIEHEHEALYNYIMKRGLPDKEKFFKMIAASHLKEAPNYYEKLVKMVEGRGKSIKITGGKYKGTYRT